MYIGTLFNAIEKILQDVTEHKHQLYRDTKYINDHLY